MKENKNNNDKVFLDKEFECSEEELENVTGGAAMVNSGAKDKDAKFNRVHREKFSPINRLKRM